jgi:hypothetical protein
MKTMKKTLKKAQKGIETKGSNKQAGRVGQAIGAATTGAIGTIGVALTKAKAKRAKRAEEEMKSEKATTPQAKYGMTMKSKSAKPKAMYGTSMKPGMMQTGGTAKGKTVKPKPMPDFVKKGNQLYSEGKIEEGKKVMREGSKSTYLKKQKIGGTTASATGYKKQMGGPASSKSCKDGKCAPGMRGTKGMGKAKSNFSKKKFSI